MVLLIRNIHLLTGLVCAVLCAALAVPTGRRALPAAGTVTPPPGRVVIVDAGHGGADGGAVSDSGVAESGLNLAIAQRLGGVLAFCGHTVTLTRAGESALCDDPSATLRQQKVSDTQNRVALVNGYPDARLISIHQNSLPGHPGVRGAQSFHNGQGSAEAMARHILGKLRGQQYQPYSAGTALLDPDGGRGSHLAATGPAESVFFRPGGLSAERDLRAGVPGSGRMLAQLDGGRKPYLSGALNICIWPCGTRERGCTPYGVHPLSLVLLVLFGAISLTAKSRTAAGGGKPPVSAWKPLCASL